MSATFWDQLPKPIIGLSPMDGVTDHPFRHIQKKYGKPALIYTEFTSTEGVCHGAEQLLKDFLFDETQRPIIAQIYGTTPQYFRESATVLCELGFDGIDINMGCPAKNVAHSGAGAALIRTPKLAQEIISATKAGIEDWRNGKRAKDCQHITKSIATEVERRHQLLPVQYQENRTIPVSVKTRIGYDKPIVEEWMPYLLEMDIAAIALHGRTLKQQYSGEANWEVIGKAAEIVHTTNTLILGNGDVSSLEDAKHKTQMYGIDGVLIGRATMGNPYIFFDEEATPATSTFDIAVEHSNLFEETFGTEEKYNFMPMRKHLGWYVKNVPNASQIRIELFKSNSAQEVQQVLSQHELV